MRKVITLILFLSSNVIYSQTSTVYTNANFNSAVDFICKNKNGNITHGGLTHELTGTYPFFQNAITGLLYQTDPGNNIIWSNSFSGVKFLKCIPSGTDNVFFALGMRLDDMTFFVAKFKDNGTVVWTKSLDNGINYSLEFSDILIENGSGNVYVSGVKYENIGVPILLGLDASTGNLLTGRTILFTNLQGAAFAMSQSNGYIFLLNQTTNSSFNVIKISSSNQVIGSNFLVSYAHSSNLRINISGLNDVNNFNEQVASFIIDKGGRTPKGIGYFSFRSDNLNLSNAFQPKFLSLEKDGESLDIQNMRQEKIDEQSICFLSSFSDGTNNFDLALAKLSSIASNKNNIDFAKEIGEDGNDLYKGGVMYSFDIKKVNSDLLVDMTREIEVSPGLKSFAIITEQHLNSSNFNCMEKELDGKLNTLSITAEPLTVFANFNEVFIQHNLSLTPKNITLNETSTSCCANAINLIPDGNFEYRFYDSTKYKTDYSYAMNTISLIPGKFTIENNQTKYAGGQHECFPAGLPALIKNHGYFLSIDSKNDLPLFWSKTVSVQPNTTYKFSVDLLNRYISDDDYYIQLFINDQLIDNIVLRIWSYCGWDTYSLNINSGNNSSLKIEFKENTSLEANANDFSLDNISLIQNGCAGIACNQRILSSDEVAEMQQMEHGSGLIVFPNPSSGKIHLKNLSTAQINGIQIFNQTGAELSTNIQTKSHESFEIDMSNYPSGVYLFKYMEDGEPKSKKIVLM